MTAKRRILGVDYGQVRIGVAISDELQMLAHPVETIPATPVEAAIRRLAALVDAKDVERVIIGLPRHMNGDVGTAAEAATVFANKLRQSVRCDVLMRDERLSTIAANRALRDAGRKARNTRGIVDQVAAQMILQGYLDSRRPAPGEVDDEAAD